jgi:site-specific DNA recombinase
MLTIANSPITREEFDALIDTVATKPEFSECFATRGCDLSLNHWWAVYVRQSLDEQARNNRLPEYLLTCAKIAKELGVLVPREYILYDHDSSEHLERSQMVFLRKTLIAQRRIGGVIFTHQGRLSAEPLHQMIFETECTHYGVKFFFGDAPTGSDFGSEAARLFLALGNKLRVRTNRDSNRAGNIGRVLKGWVPAGKSTFGYRYRKEVDPSSGATLRAWWEIDQVDPEGNVLYGSEAWVVDRVFHWINRLGINPRYAEYWSPSLIVFLVRKRCYTGKHAYNTAHYVTNPEHPLGDITGKIKRTIRKLKPEEEHVKFNVPPLVSETLWERANHNLDQRKGSKPKKQTIEALFRRRVFCPKCGRAMTLRKDPKCPNLVYYICPGYYMRWKAKHCDMRWVRMDLLDQPVWRRVKKALSHPDLVLKQMSRSDEQSQVSEVKRNLRLVEYQIAQAESGIARIQQAYENDSPLYAAEEATRRITEYRDRMLKATRRKEELETSFQRITRDAQSLEQTREALARVHLENVRSATFEEKVRVIEILDIKVYPSENLDHIGVTCAVNLAGLEDEGKPASCYNTNIASPKL